MGKTKKKSVRAQRRKANEKKFFVYAIGITLIILVLMFFIFKSVIG